MAIYEARGFQSNLVYLFDKMEPFQYIERFKPLIVPEGADLEEYKRTQAPYCLSGKITAEKTGSYKRNNISLVYRDLIFLDYDEIKVASPGLYRSCFLELCLAFPISCTQQSNTPQKAPVLGLG